MGIAVAALLGLIQALTEFLPVSSTAHLLIFGELFGHDLADPRFRAFAAIIQTGTTLAVIVYFRGDLWRIAGAGFGSLARRTPFESADSRLAWFIVLGTIPAAVAGKLLEKHIEGLGNEVIAGSLIGLGLVLLAAEKWAKHSRTLGDISAKDALAIGIGEAAAAEKREARKQEREAELAARDASRRDAELAAVQSVEAAKAAKLQAEADAKAARDARYAARKGR